MFVNGDFPCHPDDNMKGRNNASHRIALDPDHEFRRVAVMAGWVSCGEESQDERDNGTRPPETGPACEQRWMQRQRGEPEPAEKTSPCHLHTLSNRRSTVQNGPRCGRAPTFIRRLPPRRPRRGRTMCATSCRRESLMSERRSSRRGNQSHRHHGGGNSRNLNPIHPLAEHNARKNDSGDRIE